MIMSSPNWDDDYYAVAPPKPLDDESDAAFTLRHARWVRDGYQAQLSGSPDPDHALIELARRARAAYAAAQIGVLAELILTQQRERIASRYSQWQADAERVEVKLGPKYTRIDRGPEHNMSGFLMIENATGEIFGIKAYGKVHKGHRYGTLDTIDQWYWGEYGPRRYQS